MIHIKAGKDAADLSFIFSPAHHVQKSICHLILYCIPKNLVTIFFRTTNTELSSKLFQLPFKVYWAYDKMKNLFVLLCVYICRDVNCGPKCQLRVFRLQQHSRYTAGWVNLYQKFEMEKYTVCGKLILPKKNWKAFKQISLAQLACEFAWICEYLQASCIQHF